MIHAAYSPHRLKNAVVGALPFAVGMAMGLSGVLFWLFRYGWADCPLAK